MPSSGSCEAPRLVLAGGRPAARNTADPSNARNRSPNAPGRSWRFLRRGPDQNNHPDEPALRIDVGGSRSPLPERLVRDLIRSSPLVLARPAVSFLRVADQRPPTPSIRSTPATHPQTLQDARGASCALTSTKKPSGRTGPQNRRWRLTEPVADRASRGPDPKPASFLRGPSTRSCRWGSVEFVNLVRQRTNLAPTTTPAPTVWYA
jgi:hypothetical protein